MAISMKSVARQAIFALVFTTWSPLETLAEPQEGMTTERVTGPNGAVYDLRLHARPSPPPASDLAPLSELLNSEKGKESFAAEGALVRQRTNTSVDVLTYHYDNRRSGWNANELDLSPASITSSRFSLLKKLEVGGGNVLAQPLLVSNFKIKDGKDHDVLVVVTGQNNVYAFDANTYEGLWPNQSTSPINLGPSQKSEDIGCQDVIPEYGISSTPVIVRKSKDSAILYVVSATEVSKDEFHTFIHALDLSTGKDIFSPREIAPSDKYADGSKLSFSSKSQWNRAGLAYNDGSIFVSIGSHCDDTPEALSGWVLKYSENLDLKSSFHTISSPKGYQLASVWMTGFGPAFDDAGNLFISTGNGDFAPQNNYAQSIIKLKGENLEVVDYFTPSNWVELNAGDYDFGSGGVVLLPDDSSGSIKHLAAAIGKDPVIYLLDQDNLGKNQTNNTGVIQQIRVKSCTISRSCRGVWGGSSLYRSEKGLRLFVQAELDVLRSYQLAEVGNTPNLIPSAAQGTTTAGYGGSIPIVSSDGSKNAVVWLIRRSDPMELEAYDAEKLGSPLCAANIGSWSNQTYGPAGYKHGNPFITPIVANGRVYAPSFKNVYIFGLAAEGVNTEKSACSASTLATK